MMAQLLKGLEDSSSPEEGVSSPCAPPNFQKKRFFIFFTSFTSFPRLFSLDTKETKIKAKHFMD
jgi:hypothetical protein